MVFIPDPRMSYAKHLPQHPRRRVFNNASPDSPFVQPLCQLLVSYVNGIRTVVLQGMCSRLKSHQRKHKLLLRTPVGAIHCAVTEHHGRKLVAVAVSADVRLHARSLRSRER